MHFELFFRQSRARQNEKNEAYSENLSSFFRKAVVGSGKKESKRAFRHSR